jgi:fucose permease
MPVQNGGIFQAFMSFGVIAGSAIAGRYYDRLNARVILPTGTGMLALSLFGLYLADSRIVGLLSALLLGLGFGAFLLGPNLLIARLNPDNAAGALNGLNVAYGVGAILSPQLVTFGATVAAPKLAYIISGAAMILVSIPLAFVNMQPPPAADADQPPARINLWLVLPFVVLFFCSMGAEVSFNAWIVTQLEKATQVPLSVANLAASMFWIGYTASRLLAAWIGRRTEATYLLMGSIAIVGLGIVLMLSMPANAVVGLVSAAIVGIGIGPIFPTNMALVSETFPQSTGGIMGYITAVANTGPMIFPWLQGRLGAGRDGGMELILLLAVVLMATTLYIKRQQPIQPAPH